MVQQVIELRFINVVLLFFIKNFMKNFVIFFDNFTEEDNHPLSERYIFKDKLVLYILL